MPNHFKSLKIIDSHSSDIVVLESIIFLGIKSQIKTKHIILPPDTHKVFIQSGWAKGTFFVETYDSSTSGTNVKILVYLKINPILKLIPFIQEFLAKKMGDVMEDFIEKTEYYCKKNSLI